MSVVTSTDGRVMLYGISWHTYECFLKDHENQSAVRVAYDNGLMEILNPTIRHEIQNRGLASIVGTVLDTWEWDFINAGSTTFKKDSKAKGFEPDTCFYIAYV